MKISIIGTGYVGLVTGACLAEKGHDVICVDSDSSKIAQIQAGCSPIFERGLEPLLRKHIGRKLRATTDLASAVRSTDVSLIAVGTPLHQGQIDLRIVKQVSLSIGEALRDKTDYHVVVVKSTVVPGTTEGTVLPLLEQASGKKAGVDFGVGMNPEFLTEGEAIGDFMNPDRIVLGGIDQRTISGLDELYAPFENTDKLRTNPATAELIKYASNSLLATMISFSNEMANLATALGGIDIVDVMRGVHLSNYLSMRMPDGTRRACPITSFLSAGCGFGGSCLPKDVNALIAHGRRLGSSMRLLEAVIQVNEHQPDRVIDMLKKHHPSLNGVAVAVLGLSFRPDTNDMRESPAIPILRSLVAEGAHVKAYDPAAREEAKAIFRGDSVRVCEELGDTIDGAKAIIIVTRWEEFKTLPELLRNFESQPLVVDGRRMLEKKSFQRYEGIGL